MAIASVYLLGAAAAAYAAYMYTSWRKQVKLFGHIPHVSQVCTNYSIPARLFPFLVKYGPGIFKVTPKIFEEIPEGVFAIITPFNTQLWVNRAEYVRDLCVTKRKSVIKPLHVYGLLRLFGDNIVTTEGAEWGRHRLLCNPAFGDINNALVAVKAVEFAEKMFKKWEKEYRTSGDELLVNVFDQMTTLALCIISSAGFGLELAAFETDPNLIEKPEGDHKLTITECMKLVTKNMKLRLILPKWVYYLPMQRVKEVETCYNEFEAYLDEIIHGYDDRKEAKRAGDYDKGRLVTDRRSLIDLLLAALRESSDNHKGTLTPREVLSDAFIFLFAGHETTAHTLNFALGMLALHPDVQQRLYEEVVSVVGKGNPTYVHTKDLTYTQWVMNETLRLFPPVVAIPKMTSDNVQIGNQTLPANTYVTISAYSIHRNPEYYPEPEKFKPERWEECLAREGTEKFAFTPFSQGSRSCIGKRFAEVELIIILAMISKRYTIHLPKDVSPEDIYDITYKITLEPQKHWSLVFRPRHN